MAEVARPWPLEIRVKRPEKRIEIDFDDGVTFDYSAELLRVESPSAEIQGHGPGQKVLLPGRRHVAVTEAQPVGNYAVRFVFDDGHSTGIYSWDYLYKLGKEQEHIWSDYVEALDAKGWSRDP